MIVDVSERVRAVSAAGKTLDDVMAARPAAAYDDRWGTVPTSSAAAHSTSSSNASIY